MQSFWNRQADKFFSKIRQGTLTICYDSGEERTYGNGEMPRAHLSIHKPNFFKRVALYGDIGFAESYMDGDFECDDMGHFVTIALMNAKELGTLSEYEKRFSLYNIMPYLNRLGHVFRRNSKKNSQKNIAQHYDLSNEFFELMLDKTMMYSSAVFEHPDESLYDAQLRKLDILAQKLRLKEGAKVLEIGSGWGSMAMHIAKNYGCEVTTLTLSKEQRAYAMKRFKEEGVDAAIDIVLQDYRDAQGEYDAIIAIEMFEAVGREYFDVFFKKCESLLKPGGVISMQIITVPDQRYEAYAKSADFIQKYIFPGGHLPSVAKVLDVTKKHTRLNLVHMEEFGEHYAKTLRLWSKNFHEQLDEVRALGFDEYFIRMWRVYLHFCEAAFLTRNIGLVQVVFSRDNNMQLNEGLL